MDDDRGKAAAKAMKEVMTSVRTLLMSGVATPAQAVSLGRNVLDEKLEEIHKRARANITATGAVKLESQVYLIHDRVRVKTGSEYVYEGKEATVRGAQLKAGNYIEYFVFVDRPTLTPEQIDAGETININDYFVWLRANELEKIA